MPMKLFTIGMICTTQYKQDILLTNETQTCKTSIIESILTKPIQQNKPNPYSNITFSNLNKNSKIKKSKAIKMKYFEINGKPIPYLEVWRREDDENGGFLIENKVGLWVRWTDKTMNSQNERGINCPQSAKHAIFATKLSHEQVAKNLWDKILKNLSKYLSWLEGLPLEEVAKGVAKQSK